MNEQFTYTVTVYGDTLFVQSSRTQKNCPLMTRFYIEFLYIEQCPFIYVVFKYMCTQKANAFFYVQSTLCQCIVHVQRTRSPMLTCYSCRIHINRSQSPLVTRNLCRVHVQREQSALVTRYLHQVHKTDSIDDLLFEQSSSTETTKKIYNALFLQFSRTQKQFSQIIQSGEPFDDTVF